MIDHIFHLMNPSGKMAQHAFRAVIRNDPGLQQRIDVQPVGFCGRNPSGGNVGLVQETKFLQVAHLVADRGRRKVCFVFPADRAGSDRNAGQDIIVYDRTENSHFPVVHLHLTVPFLSGC